MKSMHPTGDNQDATIGSLRKRVRELEILLEVQTKAVRKLMDNNNVPKESISRVSKQAGVSETRIAFDSAIPSFPYDWIWYVGTNKMFFSPRLNEFIGLPQIEMGLDYKFWLKRMHPGDRKKILNVLRSLLSSKEDTVSVSYRVFDTSDNIQWVNAEFRVFRSETGEIAHISALHFNLSKQSDVRIQPEEYTKLLEAILHNIPAHVSARNKDGKFVFGNKSLMEFINTNLDVYKTKSIYEAERELRRFFKTEYDKSLFASQKPDIREENKTASDGSQHWFETFRKALPNRVEKDILVEYSTEITQRKLAENEAIRREELLFAVGGVIIELLRNTDLEEGIKTAIKRIGEIVQVDRAYMIKNHLQVTDEKYFCDMLYEWKRENIEILKNPPEYQKISYAGFSERWFHKLQNGEGVSETFTDTSELEFVVFEKEKLKSLLAIPIIVEDSFWGFIGFEDYEFMRKFSESEQAILKLIANNVGMFEQKYENEQQLVLANMVIDKSDMVLVVLKPDSKLHIDYISKSIEKYGYSHDEIEKKEHALKDFIHPEDYENVVSEIISHEQLGAVYFSLEYRIVTKDGSERWVDHRININRDRDDKAINYLGLLTDITVRKKTEEALQRAMKAAEDASYAKSIFLTNMSHELRTPLNGILGYAQILKDESNLSEAQRDQIKTIEHSGNHLLNIINDILDLSKIEADKMELQKRNFDIAEMLNNIAGMIRIRAEQKNLDFNFACSKEIPKAVSGDDKRLSQVLLNLLGNAVKFTDSGSISFYIDYHDGTFSFQVKDTGMGISEDKLEDIFTPFKQLGTLTQKRDGTGLGLSISRSLVQLMGSELKVKSTVGKGSTFWFDLKLRVVDEALPELKKKKGKIAGYEGDTKKILIVDDIQGNRAMLVMLMKRVGFEVIEANNGNECLQKAKEVHPDLILMDLVMPDMDGFEATSELRNMEALKGTKIIAVSASVFNNTREESFEAGCDDFMTKPIILEELFDRLQKHLNLIWKYEETPEAEAETPKHDAPEDKDIVLPPFEQLQELHSFAVRGNIKELKRVSSNIKSLDDTYIPFISMVEEMLKKFQLIQLKDLLTKYLDEHGSVT